MSGKLPWIAMNEEQDFEVRGPNSGSCGHRHPDVASALECLRQHQLLQESLGSFSDRQVVPIGTSDPERLAAARILREVEALYRAGARRDALQRLDEVPGQVDTLTDVPDLARAQRWVSRARRRIADGIELHDARAAVYLRAAANAIARDD
jgi:hypothetical protein